MLNRVDISAIQASAPSSSTSSAPAAGSSAQVIPAGSALELAQTELRHSAFDFHDISLDATDIASDSFAETLEDIGFALGSKLRESRRLNSEGGVERPRTRSMLQQLIKQINAISAAQLDELRQRIPNLDESDDLADAMRKNGFNAGEMALLLGALLEEGRLSGARRKRVEDALAATLDNDEWAIQLFAHLEFGIASRTGLTELRQLYQRATTQRQKRLVQWFEEFRKLSDRKRKLKTLIRALAFELSAEGPAMNVHLASVITDLKRVLQFLSVEDHCNRVAQTLAEPNLDGDQLIVELLEIVQLSWITAGTLADRTGAIIAEKTRQYRYARQMMEMVKLLPGDCFEDDEQQATLLEAFAEHLHMLTDADL